MVAFTVKQGVSLPSGTPSLFWSWCQTGSEESLPCLARWRRLILKLSRWSAVVIHCLSYQGVSAMKRRAFFRAIAGCLVGAIYAAASGCVPPPSERRHPAPPRPTPKPAPHRPASKPTPHRPAPKPQTHRPTPRPDNNRPHQTPGQYNDHRPEPAGPRR